MPARRALLLPLLLLVIVACTSAPTSVAPSGSHATSSAPSRPPSPSGAPQEEPSEEVTALQLDLQALEFYRGPVTGIFDTATVRALRELQGNFGLETTGELDPKTAGAIDAARGRDTENAVTSVQTALTELGYYAGLIDGDYGPATTRAMRHFQSDHGLEESGDFDATTAATLFRAYQEEIVGGLDTGETEGPNEPGTPHGPI